jgi:cellulose synthase operon protein C
MQNAGKAADATTFANTWVHDHPTDPTLPRLQAEQSQQRKDYVAARAGYERVLALNPDDIVATNNLAWLLTEEKDPKGLEYAERAHEVAPFNPDVLDTLGWSLARNGEPKRGVQLLRMASALSPAQATIRLHLAQALADSGDKPGARKELEALSRLDQESSIRSEAEKLMGTL